MCFHIPQISPASQVNRVNPSTSWDWVTVDLRCLWKTLCDRWALFRINVKVGKKALQCEHLTQWPWICVGFKSQRCTFDPQPRHHCRGFVQNELPVQKSIKCHRGSSCTWQIKVAGSADALLRCSADASRQSVAAGSSVTDGRNSAQQMGEDLYIFMS